MTDATPVAWASRSWLANPIGGNFATTPHPSFDVPLYDQAALDAAVAAALERSLDRDGDGYRLMGAQTAWQGWKAGMAALANTVQPAAWVFEWGAIDLPRGDPSRITCMSAHPTEAEALAQADGCDFNWQVYPAYCIGDSRTPNVI